MSSQKSFATESDTAYSSHTISPRSNATDTETEHSVSTAASIDQPGALPRERDIPSSDKKPYDKWRSGAFLRGGSAALRSQKENDNNVNDQRESGATFAEGRRRKKGIPGSPRFAKSSFLNRYIDEGRAALEAG